MGLCQNPHQLGRGHAYPRKPPSAPTAPRLRAFGVASTNAFGVSVSASLAPQCRPFTAFFLNSTTGNAHNFLCLFSNLANFCIVAKFG